MNKTLQHHVVITNYDTLEYHHGVFETEDQAQKYHREMEGNKSIFSRLGSCPYGIEKRLISMRGTWR